MNDITFLVAFFIDGYEGLLFHATFIDNDADGAIGQLRDILKIRARGLRLHRIIQLLGDAAIDSHKTVKQLFAVPVGD